jgi:hypothetical protein
VAGWFQHRILETGRLPLFFFFLALVAGFAFIRFSVRMIRAQVRWWPGNVTPGGLHVHHVVFGVVFMVSGGLAGLVVPTGNRVVTAIAAAVFGLGTALVLDEFALILHLRDVYWSEEGRASVNAVFVAIAVTGLLVLGVFPVGLVDGRPVTDPEGRVDRIATALSIGIGALITAALAAVTVLKGKLVTGLAGLFLPILLVVGSIRLARPGSPWARWRYRSPRRARKLARAERRDRRLRQPVVRARNWLQNAVAGRPDPPRAGG